MIIYWYLSAGKYSHHQATINPLGGPPSPARLQLPTSALLQQGQMLPLEGSQLNL